MNYWQAEPSAPAREREVRLEVPGSGPVFVTSATGVFGAQRVDHGTNVRIRQAPGPASCTGVVDVGTGYGPIAVAMGLRQPSAGIWAVDVNRRALALTGRNALAAGAHNVVPVEAEDVPAAVRFDRLYSNPPVKVGRDHLHDLLTDWLRRLVPGGDAFFVVKQSMGADALHLWLNDQGYSTLRAASKQGYRLLRVAQPRGLPQPQGLSPDELSTVNQTTGRRWSVLGRLAGGRSDSVQLLGDGPARAVLKIKQGEWWGEQLQRHETVLTALRDAGYPTPAPLGFGSFAGDRHFLATEFVAGAQPTEVDVPLATQLADAIELQATVQPPPERDWSAMITLFLNGGIREHLHSEVAGLGGQALRLIPHPVPALPGSEFVHGDLTVRNVLTDDGHLTAIVDLEGFGRGTRTIDLVALLGSLVGRASTEAVAMIMERAIAASDVDVFRACLAHRILARLLAATDRPEELPAIAETARALLALDYGR